MKLYNTKNEILGTVEVVNNMMILTTANRTYYFGACDFSGEVITELLGGDVFTYED